ncbi:MAG: DsrE family protein [Chitinophagaceae bacterium]|nr:DsrE family protein [Chitinophagaceae bacterium]
MQKIAKQIMLPVILIICISLMRKTPLMAQTTTSPMKFLVQVTCGTENPTKAALAFLLARTATEEGNTVNLFLAGDGVTLIRDQTIESLSGLGTGKLKEHLEVLLKAGVKIYLSTNSSKARGITEADLTNKNASFALPTQFIKLIKESDKVIVY